MKSSSITYKNYFGVVFIALGLFSINVARAQIFIANVNNGTIGEYNLDGTTVNASLITGLYQPDAIAIVGSEIYVVSGGDISSKIGVYTTSGATINASLISGISGDTNDIAVSGSNIFVVNADAGTVGEYTTSGATVNASLIAGLPSPFSLLVSGSDLFISSAGNGIDNGIIGEYTTSGTTINASLVSGISGYPQGIVKSGSDLFVGTYGRIREYTTSGATVNAALISDLEFGGGDLAIFGSDLFVTNSGNNTIGEYTLSGVPVNTALISGLHGPESIAVVSTPEPSTWMLLLGGLGLLAFWGRRIRQSVV